MCVKYCTIMSCGGVTQHVYRKPEIHIRGCPRILGLDNQKELGRTSFHPNDGKYLAIKIRAGQNQNRVGLTIYLVKFAVNSWNGNGR